MRELWGSPAQWIEKKSYVEVAKKLGVDEETVRNRVKFMRESGFLIGWRTVPSPAVLRKKPSLILLETEEGTKERTISLLKKVDGVVTIISIYGDAVIVNLYEDEAQRSLKELNKVSGVKISPLTVPHMNMPQGNFRMTPTDWRIVGLLLKDAQRKLSEVASELKISQKTVKRRLNAMMEASAILIMPMVNLKKSTGVPYSLMINSDESKKAKIEMTVASRIGNLVFRANASTSGSIFGFTGANVAEGNEMLKWVRQLDGVKTADIYISEEVIHVFDWLEKEVEKYAAS
jgi:DNA-binding Lrp family transcriptional regulator